MEDLKIEAQSLINVIEENNCNEGCVENAFREFIELLFKSTLEIEGITLHFTELEVYYYSKKHPDPYVHAHPDQLGGENNFYNHGSGLDIVFGRKADNEQDNIYFGVLIRGVKFKSDTNVCYIDGPLCVKDRLLNIVQWKEEDQKKSCFVKENFLFEYNEANNKFKIVYLNGGNNDVFIAPRFGLNPKGKENASGEYLLRNYRFVIDDNPQHRYQEKTIVKAIKNRNVKILDALAKTERLKMIREKLNRE